MITLIIIYIIQMKFHLELFDKSTPISPCRTMDSTTAKIRFSVGLIGFLVIQLSIIDLSKCSNKHDSINHNYLFATKTAYHQAYSKLQKNSNQISDYNLPTQCKPKMFYMICRHATRYPSKKKITRMQEKIYLLRDRLVAGGHLSLEQMERFKSWKLRMQLDDDNRISDTGFSETRELAKRIKQDYPLFFDLDKTNLKLYTTYKKRTNETAFAFYDEIYKDQEFKPTMKPHLWFHAQCKKLLINNGVKLIDPKIVKDLIASDVVKNMQAKMAKNMGIESNQFDFKSLKMIYITCSFEYAIFNDTLWCDLFSKEDFQIMEYILDLKSYSIGGHGHNINSRMACPVLVDLMQHLNETIKDQTKLTTSLQFSHSGIFKRIYAMLGVFKNFGSSHCRSSIECFDEWRSSLILPFLANIKFLLYDCSPNGSDYRLMVKIQEHLVKIDGCTELLCPLDDFMRHYQSKAERLWTHYIGLG